MFVLLIRVAASGTRADSTGPVVGDIAQANGATPARIALAGLLALAALPRHVYAQPAGREPLGRHRRAAAANVRGEPGGLVEKPPPIIIRRQAPTYRGYARQPCPGHRAPSDRRRPTEHPIRGTRPNERPMVAPTNWPRTRARSADSSAKTFENAWSAQEGAYAQPRRRNS
jgi:hypothetical protein